MRQQPALGTRLIGQRCQCPVVILRRAIQRWLATPTQRQQHRLQQYRLQWRPPRCQGCLARTPMNKCWRCWQRWGLARPILAWLSQGSWMTFIGLSISNTCCPMDWSHQRRRLGLWQPANQHLQRLGRRWHCQFLAPTRPSHGLIRQSVRGSRKPAALQSIKHSVGLQPVGAPPISPTEA